MKRSPHALQSEIGVSVFALPRITGFSNLDEFGSSTVSSTSPFRDVGRISELSTIKARASLLTYAWYEFLFIHIQVISHVPVSP